MIKECKSESKARQYANVLKVNSLTRETKEHFPGSRGQITALCLNLELDVIKELRFYVTLEVIAFCFDVQPDKGNSGPGCA